MGLETITTSPSPITLAEAKQHLRIDSADDDGVLAFLIDAATEFIEEQTGRQLRPATFELTLDQWPGPEIRLPRPPLRSVDNVWCFNAAGQQQIVPASLYTVDTHSKPGRIVLKPNRQWPTTDGSANAIKFEFTAGQEDAALVPATLKQAVRFMIGLYYENREAATDRTFTKVPLTVESIIEQHKVWEAV